MADRLTHEFEITYKEVLEQRTVDELKEIARVSQLSRFSGMRKSELVEMLCTHVLEPRPFSLCLLTLIDASWTFFKKAVSGSPFTPRKALRFEYLPAYNLGFICAFVHKGKQVFVVPLEVSQAFAQLPEQYYKKKKLSEQLNKYVLASISLYHIISKNDFVDLYNRFESKKITQEEMCDALYPYAVSGIHYLFFGDYIIADYFSVDDFAEIPKLLEAQIGKPRYLPSKSEFLKYSDDSYFEMTPQALELEDYLRKLVGTRAHEFLDELHLMTIMEEPYEYIVADLERMGLVFERESQLRPFIDRLIAFQNGIRLPSNCGHTPAELSTPLHDNVLPFRRSESDIGRNAPCPCGSGMKYKNCCGKGK